MRKLDHVAGEWRVRTVAGVPGSAGGSDGSALADARLAFPGHLAASATNSSVYLVEESGNPSIREYREAQGDVVTLYRGSPLVAPGSLCLGDQNNILICDAGAGCIWSLDLDTKALTAKITTENMFLFSVEMHEEPVAPARLPIQHQLQAVATSAAAAAAIAHYDEAMHKQEDCVKRVVPSSFIRTSATATEFQFTPTAIARHSPGCYVFADSGGVNSLFRYFEGDVVELEKATTTKSMNEVFDL